MATRVKSGYDVDRSEVVKALRDTAAAIEDGGPVDQFIEYRNIDAEEPVDCVLAVKYHPIL